MYRRIIKTPLLARRATAGFSNIGRALSSEHIVKAPISMPELSDPAITSKSFPAFVMEKFDEHGDSVAIVDGSNNKELTYNQVKGHTHSLAAALQKSGINHHDTVAVMSPNHVHYFSVFMGISVAGAYSTCLNPMYEEAEIKVRATVL